MGPPDSNDGATMVLADHLRTERVVLRPLRAHLAPDLFRLIDSDRVHLGRTMDWVRTIQCVADQVARLRKAEEARVTGAAYPFAPFEADSEGLMGAVGVHRIDRAQRCAELGYWVGTEFAGCGLVSEAVDALGCASFAVGFRRLEIRCSSRNERSSALAERCGFHLEQRVEGGGQHGEGPSDQLVFARLSEHA